MATLKYVPRKKVAGEAEADAVYKQQRAENERLKAEDRAQKLAISSGKLVNRDDCLKQAGTIMNMIRQRLLLVPAVASRKLAFDDSRRHAAKLIIGDEIRSALEELSNFPENVVAAGTK